MPREEGPKAERRSLCGIGVEDWSVERGMVVGVASLMGPILLGVCGWVGGGFEGVDDIVGCVYHWRGSRLK